MNHVFLLITAVMAGVYLLMVAPRILAMNRGKILQQIALWLGLIVILALVYKYLGPGSESPLFTSPAITATQKGPSNEAKGHDEKVIKPHEDNSEVPGSLPKVQDF